MQTTEDQNRVSQPVVIQPEPPYWRRLLRIVDTTIGGCIALTVAYLLRPPSASRW
jgi:hypothetical protein